MTTPRAATTPPARAPQPWWVRPGIVLPIVGALALLVALFTPTVVGPRSGDPRLSTLSTAPLGASLLHDLAQRLGWQTDRRMRAGFDAAPDRVLAVLDPAIPLRASETHALLEHVRAGGAALVVVGGGTAALLDSLHLRIGSGGRALRVEYDEAGCAGRELPTALSLWFGQAPQMLTLQWTAPPPAEVRRFLLARRTALARGDTIAPTMVGFALGAGRLVVSADPDQLRNDAMRDCAPGFDVAAVRALEYLREGGAVPRTRLLFDEYHQAHGARPGTISAALFYLGASPSGRLLAQLALAGLVLLLALGPRTVPPRPDTRLERRSPLEQVDALARAYAQVGATRTAAQRLVRALRHRADRTVGRERRGLGDDAWLAAVASRHPTLGDDVALARRALAESLPGRTFATLGPALHRIEATLTRT